jgi:hypothetical protein
MAFTVEPPLKCHDLRFPFILSDTSPFKIFLSLEFKSTNPRATPVAGSGGP